MAGRTNVRTRSIFPEHQRKRPAPLWMASKRGSTKTHHRTRQENAYGLVKETGGNPRQRFGRFARARPSRSKRSEGIKPDIVRGTRGGGELTFFKTDMAHVTIIGFFE